MRHLSAFFVAAARPAMVVWGLLGAVVVWMLTYAVNDSDFPMAAGDTVFVAAFGYPAMAGLLAGLVVQELQHCWFAWTLPGLRWKTAVGFAAGGLLFTLLVALLLLPSAVDLGVWSLFAIGFSAYCLGGVLLVPGAVATPAGFSLVLAAWLFSDRFGALCAANEAVAVVSALSLAGLCLALRFSTATVRALPFLPIIELAGSFTTEHHARRERDKLVRKGPREWRWPDEYLGTSLAGRVRAGLYENFGSVRPRDLSVLLGPLGWLALLLSLDALGAKEGGSWLMALSERTYHGLFMPPHLPPLPGEKAPYDLTTLFVGAAGLILFLRKPKIFDSRRFYPLARREVARATYWFSAVISLIYLTLASVILFLVGLAAGWGAGIELRLGFVPLFLRAALVTVILLPIPQWIGLRMGGRPVQNAFAGLLVGVLAFVAVVTFVSLVLAALALAPVTELLALLALVVLSQTLFRRKVDEYFGTADLV